MSLLLCLLGCAALFPAQEIAGLTREQSQAVHDSLFATGLTLADLRAFEPELPDVKFVRDLHQDPLPKLMSLPSQLGFQDPKDLRNNPVAFLRRVVSGLPDPPLARRPTIEINLPQDVPPAMRSSVIRIVRAVVAAHDEVRGSLEKLSAEEKRELIEGLPRLALHPDLYALDFVRLPMPARSRMDDLLTRTDLGRIGYAAERLYGEVESILSELSASAPPSFRSKLKFTVEGITVVLAGFADDRHEDRDAMLTLDVGGDDRYSGRHGAGIGYASVFIDLSGDDEYDVPDVSLGAGLLGVGLAWDLGGRDRIRSRSLALGAGVGGVGCFRSGESAGAPRGGLIEDSGDDIESIALAQGFAMHGTGAFVRSGRRDLYRAQFLSQGSALKEGVGLAFDSGGNDTWLSDGLAPSDLSDAILRSRSQGFGESGGIGVLLSGGPNALHVAGAEAQGCGREGGVGVAVGGTEARWRVDGLGQAFGDDGGIGCLFGGKEFVCGGGAAQGAGSHSGIGLLAASPGNTHYSAAHGSPASGLNGGLGILVDFEGMDRYGELPSAASIDLGQSGTGLLVDLGGANSFRFVDPVSSIRALGPSRVLSQIESKQETSVPRADPPGEAISLRGDDAIEQVVRTAAGLAPHARRGTRATARRSLEASLAAVAEWLEHLRRPLRPLEAETLGGVFAGAKEDVTARLKRLAGFANATVARNALRVVGKARLSAAKEEVLAASLREETDDAAMSAALDLELSEALPSFMALAGSGSTGAKRLAAIAVSRWGGPETLATSQALLASPDPVVRAAASAHFGRLKPASIDGLKALSGSANDVSARAAMRALGLVGSSEALDHLATKLRDTRPALRIEALRALAGQCPRDHRAEFEAKRNDTDARVRHVAAGLDPSR